MADNDTNSGGVTRYSESFWEKIRRNPWFWSALGGIVFLTAIRPLMRHVPDPPPILSTLPSFQLVDQNGQALGSSELRGQVYVASFFFTTCKSICPALMRSVKELQHRYAAIRAKIRLVSITVDPENDTPEVLKGYARTMEIDTDQWSLLTGSRTDIKKLLTEGFLADMGEKERFSDNLVDIAHSSKLVLVDKEGNIRGYYGSDATGIDEVFHRSLHVEADD